MTHRLWKISCKNDSFYYHAQKMIIEDKGEGKTSIVWDVASWEYAKLLEMGGRGFCDKARDTSIRL